MHFYWYLLKDFELIFWFSLNLMFLFLYTVFITKQNYGTWSKNVPFVLSVIFIKRYFTSHKYLFSKEFDDTAEISDNEYNSDIELPTQQNDIDNENCSVNTGNSFAKNQDGLNER